MPRRPHGDFFKYTYDEPVHLQSEMDGVRIISNSKCEFLQVRRSSRARYQLSPTVLPTDRVTVQYTV